MAILSKERKPDNFESHNSLKLSFSNIWDLGLNFSKCQSILESNFPQILARQRETDLDDSIDSGDILVKDHLSSKNFITHMHGPAVYVKEGLLFS